MKVIVVRGLSKFFDGTPAVDGISFDVERQECFGLLGPNGAGKTTTARMVSCFSPPTDGLLEVLGENVRGHVRGIKARLGVCPQENNLDPDLNVFENLRVYARYFDFTGREAVLRCEELLSFVGLAAKKKNDIDELSGGMKRRLMIARALVNRPELLILDEPTTGLDPQARHQIWQNIGSLKKEGTTVLLTTHYMEEAAHLCDRLLIMDGGKIVAAGRPRDLVREHVGSHVIEIASHQPAVEIYLKEKHFDYEKTISHTFVYVRGGEGEYAEFSRRFGDEVCVLRMANLEDVFLKLTGRDLRT